ncbi:MAG: MopE-related protein [Myxococcota bacterium]
MSSFVACSGNQPEALDPEKLEIQSELLTPSSTGYMLDFGDVPLDSRKSYSFVLTNSGDEPLTLQSVTLVSGSLSIFDVTWDRTTELEGGMSSTVSVTFIPTKVQTYTGRIQVRSTDEENPSILIDVKGKGTPSTLDKDGDGVSPADGDCNDSDFNAFPGNSEQCDGKDNDCDGTVPANENNSDGDAQRVCQGDCDDSNKNTYVGAPEICDGKDNNCDGIQADGLDANDDGQPDGTSDLDKDGWTICAGDCNDNDNAISPATAEVCDERDNDCDGKKDNIDQDKDGYSLCDPAQDCNDADATAHPTYVDSSFKGTSVGSYAAPYTSVNAALEGLDASCRTVYIKAGTYSVNAFALSDGKPLTLEGADPSTVILKPSATGRIFTLSNRSKLTLINVGLTGGNASGTGGGDGGVILANNADVTLEGVSAYANKSAADGGVVFVQSGKLSVKESTFSSNVAGDDGGAILVLSGEFSDADSIYANNQGAKGGAIGLQSSKLTSGRRLVFEGNKASDSGGALSAIGVTQLRLEQSIFWTNSATSYGGAAALDDVVDSGGYLRNCLFQNNSAGTQGGALSLAGVQSVVIQNNTMTENVSVGEGGGIMIRATADTARTMPLASTPRILANIIAWTQGKNGLYVESTGSTVQYNTVFNTNSGVNFAGAGINPTQGSFSSSSGDYNLADNPLFVSFETEGAPEDDDLHLQSSSTSRNTGLTGSSNNDPDGSRNDRGAYGGPSSLPLDVAPVE